MKSENNNNNSNNNNNNSKKYNPGGSPDNNNHQKQHPKSGAAAAAAASHSSNNKQAQRRSSASEQRIANSATTNSRDNRKPTSSSGRGGGGGGGDDSSTSRLSNAEQRHHSHHPRNHSRPSQGDKEHAAESATRGGGGGGSRDFISTPLMDAMGDRINNMRRNANDVHHHNSLYHHHQNPAASRLSSLGASSSNQLKSLVYDPVTKSFTPATEAVLQGLNAREGGGGGGAGKGVTGGGGAGANSNDDYQVLVLGQNGGLDELPPQERRLILEQLQKQSLQSSQPAASQLELQYMLQQQQQRSSQLAALQHHQHHHNLNHHHSQQLLGLGGPNSFLPPQTQIFQVGNPSFSPDISALCAMLSQQQQQTLPHQYRQQAAAAAAARENELRRLSFAKKNHQERRSSSHHHQHDLDDSTTTSPALNAAAAAAAATLLGNNNPSKPSTPQQRTSVGAVDLATTTTAASLNASLLKGAVAASSMTANNSITTNTTTEPKVAVTSIPILDGSHVPSLVTVPKHQLQDVAGGYVVVPTLALSCVFEQVESAAIGIFRNAAAAAAANNNKAANGTGLLLPENHSKSEKEKDESRKLAPGGGGGISKDESFANSDIPLQPPGLEQLRALAAAATASNTNYDSESDDDQSDTNNNDPKKKRSLASSSSSKDKDASSKRRKYSSSSSSGSEEEEDYDDDNPYDDDEEHGEPPETNPQTTATATKPRPSPEQIVATELANSDLVGRELAGYVSDAVLFATTQMEVLCEVTDGSELLALGIGCKHCNGGGSCRFFPKSVDEFMNGTIHLEEAMVEHITRGCKHCPKPIVLIAKELEKKEKARMSTTTRKREDQLVFFKHIWDTLQETAEYLKEQEAQSKLKSSESSSKQQQDDKPSPSKRESENRKEDDPNEEHNEDDEGYDDDDNDPLEMDLETILADSDLVLPGDRHLVQDSIFVALAQFKSSSSTTGTTSKKEGMAEKITDKCILCRHCNGTGELGRLKLTNVTDFRKDACQRALEHITKKCKKCPSEIRSVVLECQLMDPDQDSMKSNPLEFYNLVWLRLHSSDNNNKEATQNNNDNNKNAQKAGQSPVPGESFESAMLSLATYSEYIRESFKAPSSDMERVSWEEIVPSSSLVKMKERGMVPDAFFACLAQMEPSRNIRSTAKPQNRESSSNHNRHGGTTGLCCGFCGDNSESGRFPVDSAKSISFGEIMQHVTEECEECPEEVKFFISMCAREENVKRFNSAAYEDLRDRVWERMQKSFAKAAASLKNGKDRENNEKTNRSNNKSIALKNAVSQIVVK